MKSKPITIKDIARELSISPSTVSRALKDHPDISKETKKLVADLAKQMDYQPNSIALSLRKQKTHTIGVIIPELVHFFFANVISGIEDVADQAGYNVILCQSNESYEKEVRDTHTLISHRVDGLLVSVSKETTDFDHFNAFIDRGVPIVFFDRTKEGVKAHQVVVDDLEGSFKAVEHLIEMGCRRIAHLAGPEKLSISSNRKQGYVDALKKHGMPIDESLIVNCNLGIDVNNGEEVAHSLLTSSDPPDGIFANNDLTAIGAMKAAKKLGLNIPGDLAVIGFSNWQMAAMVDPPLSSVHQPGFEMGQTAARLFIDQLTKDSDHFIPEKVVLKTEVVVRESSRRK